MWFSIVFGLHIGIFVGVRGNFTGEELFTLLSTCSLIGFLFLPELMLCVAWDPGCGHSFFITG